MYMWQSNTINSTMVYECKDERYKVCRMTDKQLSHLNKQGEAHMVDVSQKDITTRIACAEGFVTMQPETLQIMEAGNTKKGDVLAAARIAGIMAAKKTADLIPLCHPLPLSKITIEFTNQKEPCGVLVSSTVKLNGKTGVEMEALTAVSVACLTLYDMLKSVDKAMALTDIRLTQKTGGKSGDYHLER